MRQVIEKPPEPPKLGETRKIIKKIGFFFPITLPVKGTDRIEKRWSEVAEIEQIYTEVDGGGYPIYDWKDNAFLE